MSIILYFANNYLNIKNQKEKLQKQLDENNNKEKFTSEIFRLDIEKSLKLASIYISNGLIKGVVSDKLTTIKDFKSQLDVISSKLTKTEINQLINYYSILSELEDIQNDYKNLIENFFNDHPTLKRDSINFVNIKGKNSHDKLFYELMQKLFNTNITDLMNALGKI